MAKLSALLSKTAYCIYAVLFGYIFYVSFFYNYSFQYDTSVLFTNILKIIIFLSVFLFVYSKFSDFLHKYRYLILLIAVCGIFCVQLSVSNQMYPTVVDDLANVQRGAILYVTGENPDELAYYVKYYHKYPNQVGIFLIQQLLFKIASYFGYTDFFTVACVFGHILFTVMIITSFIYLDENINGHRAIFFLVLICIFPPIYLQSSISYTDTYSIWGIPCLLLFISRGLKADSIWKKSIYACLSGLFMGTVIQIKTTAIFVVIAFFIQMIVTALRIKNISFFAVLMSCFFIVNSAFSTWGYNTVMDPNRSNEALPVTHWIMMGLQEDGAYSYYDEFKITLSVPPEERPALISKVIEERLSEMDTAGFLNLLYRKICRTFGSGNAAIDNMYRYADELTEITGIYEYTLADGEHFQNINDLSQSIYLMIIAIGVIGAVIIVFKNSYMLADFAPYISLIGFWMFMMIWESNHRQLVNQWSLFFIVAAIGLYNIWKLMIKDMKCHIKNQI